MRKSIISFVLAFSLLFAFSASSAYAFDLGSFSARFRENKENFREEKKASMEAKRDDKKENREESQEERREKMRKLFGVMIKRYESAVSRLKTLIERIESRVAKIKAENPSKDVADIEVQIANAKSKLDLIPAKITTLKTDFEAVLTSTTPKEAFKKLLTDARSIKKDLVEVHKILVKVIGDIKGLRVGEEN